MQPRDLPHKFATNHRMAQYPRLHGQRGTSRREAHRERNALDCARKSTRRLLALMTRCSSALIAKVGKGAGGQKAGGPQFGQSVVRGKRGGARELVRTRRAAPHLINLIRIRTSRSVHLRPSCSRSRYEAKPTADPAWQLAQPPVPDRSCSRQAVPHACPIRIHWQLLRPLPNCTARPSKASRDRR